MSIIYVTVVFYFEGLVIWATWVVHHHDKRTVEMLGRDEYLSNAKRLGLSCNDGGYDTDFPNAITRTGFVQSHHVAFSGGSDQSNYRASLGYVKHNTVIKINEFRNLASLANK